MSKTWVIVLSLLLIGASQPRALGFERVQQEPPAADAAPDELVLVGTVKRIYQMNAPRQRRRWAVEVRVDRVVSGEFDGPTFTFAVHSPSQSGLQVRRTYTIRANRVDGVYLVKEHEVEEVRPARKPSGKR